MTEPIADPLSFPAIPAPGAAADVLTQLLRTGAQRLLAQAVEAEVEDWVTRHAPVVDAAGHRQVVRNGHLPQRQLLTPVGPVEVCQPRVHDRRPAEQREKFTSALLPPYLRKTPSLEALIPWLYLKGVSTGDMTDALAALVGPQAAGLSATTVTRLKSQWEQEFRTWAKRDLSQRQYVYLWADGVYFQIRLEDEGHDRQCLLVLLGATADGTKELIAIADGYRESKQSWRELLLDAQARGLSVPPKLATGDGALGFWAALREVFPTCREQRCWVHKAANVLNKLPRHLHAKANRMLQDIWMAATRAEAHRAFALFLETYRAKYPAAVSCLEQDRGVLLSFYDFPAEHWKHLRTTNPIESVFATVRLRHDRTKGNGSRLACLAMVFKLMQEAAKTWRKLDGATCLTDVIAGVIYEDGVRKTAA
jgi:putative transposase